MQSEICNRYSSLESEINQIHCMVVDKKRKRNVNPHQATGVNPIEEILSKD